MMRWELKAEKQDLLPRYRGAKANVKNLRIRLNSLPLEEELLPGVPVVDDVEAHNVLLGAYEALSRLVIVGVPGSGITEADVEKAQDFIAWWEFHHSDLPAKTG